MNILNVEDFINPMKGNAVFNLKPILENYKKHYYEYYSGKIKVSCVYNKYTDRYMFFFKVPSESNDKYPVEIDYDVILEFDPPSNGKSAAKAASDLNPYNIYIFSNSPSFVFSFDYVIKHRFGFPKCLPSKYLSNIACSRPPEIRNRYEIMTIEKTTWVAFFHLYHNGYLNKETLQTLVTKNTENYYLRLMETQPEKLKEIKAVQDMVRDANKKEREKKKAANSISNKPHYFQAASILDNPLTHVFKNTLQNRKLEKIKNKNANVLKANLKAFK